MATVEFKIGLTDKVRLAIRHIMKETGRQQGELAPMLGISQASVSRKLNTGSKASAITLDDLEVMAKGLGLDIHVSFSPIKGD